MVGTSGFSAMGAPSAEVEIDEVLVKALLAEQHPDLADLSLRPVGSGWDNAIFRLGDELAVRLPRRLASVPLAHHEHRWLHELGPRLPLPIPVPIRVGVAGHGYPWPWSITPWFAGSTAEVVSPSDLVTLASQLGNFVRSLHHPAPDDAPHNPFRGVPLSERDERTRHGLSSLDNRQMLLSVWAQSLATPEWRDPTHWLHGDLHPLNLVMGDGRLKAVIDFGDLCAGDPAVDLAIAWTLFPKPIRSVFREAVGVDENTWQRGRGWAISLGVAWANGGERLAKIGRTALSAVLSDG